MGRKSKPIKLSKKLSPTLLLLVALVFSVILNFYSLLKSKLEGDPGTPPSPTKDNNQEHSVTRVIDGDTFDIEDDTRIRLRGADAPELPEGCLSQQSKERLEELILGKSISLTQQEQGKFLRTIAYVWQGDLLIDQALVEEGLAQAQEINNPDFGAPIASAQDRAKSAERGVWSAKCQQPADKNCTIKGNFRQDKDTKIYHTLDCYNYEKITVNEKEKDQWFCSENEAKLAGFTKSRDCPGYK